ncbi:MAG: C4-dicarboxylate ABC transporter permease, partial [Desulfobacterales bacterium]|nr:C4-dicarboxylate ABC transporter permease [Desulfobacterales bacterium]
MAIVAFTIPYIFVFNHALLFKGGLFETLSLLLLIVISVVFLSAAVTGFFINHISLPMRAVMLLVAAAGVVLCTYRELVALPSTFVAAVLVTLAFLAYVYLRKPGQSQAA